MAPQTVVRVIKILIACCLLIAASTVTAGSPVRVAGTFSSLKYNAEAGDLIGYEVRLIPSNEGLKAVVQVAQGDSGKVYLVDARQDGNMVSFDVPISSNTRGRFQGTLSTVGLEGLISYPSGASEAVLLKRAASYWER